VIFRIMKAKVVMLSKGGNTLGHASPSFHASRGRSASGKFMYSMCLISIRLLAALSPYVLLT
jgi:hypothetical protein